METREADTFVTDEDINNMTEGLLQIYKEPLTKVSENLTELTTKQRTLIEDVSNQNLKLSNTQNSEAVKNLFSEVSQCKQKLIMIKKQMISIHERSGKLRVRSQNVLNKATLRHMARVQEQEREQRLIGGHSSQQPPPRT